MPKPQKIKRKKRRGNYHAQALENQKKKNKRQHYYQRKNEQRKRKEIFLPMCMPTKFSPHFGEKTFLPFFFPILPKIHQTKHTLCVPIFIKSHTKKLNKRWASIPIKNRKKEKKKKKKKKMGIYQILLRCSFALVPSLLIFIKSHTKQLDKRWAPIKFFYAARLLLSDLCQSICTSIGIRVGWTIQLRANKVLNQKRNIMCQCTRLLAINKQALNILLK